MDGTHAIRKLLAEDDAVTALVPANAVPSRMSAEDLAQGVELPAISIEWISSVDRNLPRPGTDRRVTDRIQVTGHAKNYTALGGLMRAVKKACADKQFDMTGLRDVVVRTAGAGPQGISLTTNARAQTRDFMVSYIEEC